MFGLFKKKEKVYDCLNVGACCEDCKYGGVIEITENRWGEKQEVYSCDPKKLKADRITKVGIGVEINEEDFE